MPHTNDTSAPVAQQSTTRLQPVSIHISPVGTDQYCIVASVNQSADAFSASLEVYENIERFLRGEGLQVIHERLFGSSQCYADVLRGRNQAQGDPDPVRASLLTYVQGHPLWGSGLAGVQIRAVRLGNRGGSITPISDGGRLCGRSWIRNGSRYLVLQNLNGLPAAASEQPDRRIQSYEMFNRARCILQTQGAAFANVARTWIYLSNILDWYGEFNEIRNEKYRDYGLMPQRTNHASSYPIRLPASTGIQGDNPLGAAVVSDLLAIVPQGSPAPDIEFLSNVRQKDAFRYGAAFSRGTLIREPGLTQFQISGTAAIDEQGSSLFPDDITGQVNRTFDNLTALMRPVGADFSKIVSATVFLKRPQDAGLYFHAAAHRSLEPLPAVYMVADVCRPELLFEVDAEAAW